VQLTQQSGFALGAALAMHGLGRIALREHAFTEARRWLTLAAEAMIAIDARVEADRTRRDLADVFAEDAKGES